MISSITRTAMVLSTVSLLATAHPQGSGPPYANTSNSIPAGYQVGLATVSSLPRPIPTIRSHPNLLFPPKQQDYEPVGQKSICNTNCQLAHPFATTSGPDPLPAGVFAAAINPALGGGPDSCAPCGSCYSIISSGAPYCNPDPYDPSCGYVDSYPASSLKDCNICIEC